MNEKTMENNEFEIDVRRLIEALLKRAWLILAASIVGAVITLVVTVLFVTPEYESSAMFYVNNNSFAVGDASFSIDSGDISASKSLVNSYIVILNTRESLNDVIDYSGVNRSYEELLKMISAASVNSTEIFEVVVTSEDPVEAEKIASAIAYILPKRISGIIEGTSAKIVDSAVIPSAPSSPSYTKNTMIGFLAAFVLAVCVLALREIFNITIRSEEDIIQTCKYPVLAAVPDMNAQGKGAYDYAYDRKKTAAKNTKRKASSLVGADISFAAAESYKLLRTKLQFSFADEGQCHIIGVSSALREEGKSLSSINLAYSMSQLGKKVILVDCDMRRPTLAEKLGIQKKPGLSSFLTGQSSEDSLIQLCNIPGEERAFHVISAGQNPPNPVELLSSSRMGKMLKALSKAYDYIILDLPPVEEVSDALAVAGRTDGILLVVRQDHCDRQVLRDTVRQFEFVDAKILGIVYNCTTEAGGKGYYNKYGRHYYRRESTGNEKTVEKKQRTQV